MSPSRAPDANKGPGQLDHSPLATLLGYQLAQATIPTNRLFKSHVQDAFQLNKLEFTILLLLSGNADVTPKRLAVALNIPGPNLTLILDRLETRELLLRQRNEVDRRSQHVRITEAGQALVARLQATMAEMEKELLGHLTGAEQAMLFELLRKVAAHRRV